MKRKALATSKSDFKEDIQQSRSQLKQLMASEIDDSSFLGQLSQDDDKNSGGGNSKSLSLDS